MEKKTSLAKIESNKRNAALSTGPRTPEGKSNARWNSMKHGLLAKEVVIREGDGKESKQEFQTLLASLRDDLQPDGVLEEMLVEKITVCYWRLRRAIRSEVGEIRGVSDTYVFDQTLRHIEGAKDTLATPSITDRGCERGLLKSTAGIKELLNVIEELRGDIEDNGKFSDEAEKQLIHVFGIRDPGFGRELFGLNWMASEEGQDSYSSDPDVIGTPPNPELCREMMLEMLANKVAMYKDGLDVMREKEDYKTKSDLAKLSLPGVGASDRILRYETAIERQLYRAIDQLERLQRRRNGEYTPPPINVELNGEA
jgi:hypothetical protein